MRIRSLPPRLHRVLTLAVSVLLAASSGIPSANPDPGPGSQWQWPVSGARSVVEPFRAPAHAYGPGHRGMDVAGAIGTVVVAPADGTVAFRGTVVDRPLITIDHGDGHVTTWEPVSSDLSRRPGGSRRGDRRDRVRRTRTARSAARGCSS